MPTYTKNMTVSGFSGNHYQHRVILDLVSQDVENNRSRIRRRQQLRRIGTVTLYNNTNTSTRSLSTTGASTSSGTFSFDFRNKPTNHVITLYDNTYWANHNDDGTLTITTSANMNIPDMTSNGNIGSQSWVLPRIPRGPFVNHNGTWKRSILYVNHNGTWKQATPYVNHNGTWKVGK